MRVLLLCLLLACANAQGVLLDQIAVVVGQSIIKDSDIDRQLRVTQFLNREPLQITPVERKKAVSQLVDQVLLREEIRAGSYPNTPRQESNRQLEALINQRFRTQMQFATELKRYGLDEATLQNQFRFQLTVLSFIDARFKPSVVISDAAAEKYSNENAAALHKSNPKATSDQLLSQARGILTEEEVNRLFFAWLDDRRKSAKITFHEEGLA